MAKLERERVARVKFGGLSTALAAGVLQVSN